MILRLIATTTTGQPDRDIPLPEATAFEMRGHFRKGGLVDLLDEGEPVFDYQAKSFDELRRQIVTAMTIDYQLEHMFADAVDESWRETHFAQVSGLFVDTHGESERDVFDALCDELL
ncbi:hypothetical protein [Chrysiogenes arsenatis]|uniref:hypothetical protein n=1 Tax=Chrysiogenes arsenatis TaxID=309797 RepID=UPI0003F67E89|nr:hypothetical protein [Chrysiogenes arsenatis]